MKKETKKFFSYNNSLNKGFYQPTQEGSANEELLAIFPKAEVMAAYEEIMPGTMEKLIAMMQIEQQQKYALENAKLMIKQKADLTGKVFAIFTVIILGWTTVSLARYNLNYSLFFGLSVMLTQLAIVLLLKRRKNNIQLTSMSKNQTQMTGDGPSVAKNKYFQQRRFINKK
jgi:uncharacterized membrane protein